MAPSLEIVDSPVVEPKIHEKEQPIVSAELAIPPEVQSHESQLQSLESKLQELASVVKSAGESAKAQFQLEDHPINSERSIRVSTASSLLPTANYSRSQ
jgi:hypothetical protein